MTPQAHSIRIRPGTTVKPVEIAEGTSHRSLADAIFAEAEVPDGLDPWVEVEGVFFGPDQIRVLKRVLEDMREATEGRPFAEAATT